MYFKQHGRLPASKKTLKGDHAEHIHAHCNCEFAIRFDGRSTVAGYDPEACRAAYCNAEGSTPQEKVNAMRRDSICRRFRALQNTETRFL